MKDCIYDKKIAKYSGKRSCLVSSDGIPEFVTGLGRKSRIGLESKGNGNSQGKGSRQSYQGWIR